MESIRNSTPQTMRTLRPDYQHRSNGVAAQYAELRGLAVIPGCRLTPGEFLLINQPVHPRPCADRVEQRPVALLDDVSLGEGRARLLAERSHHPVVAVVAKQHHADQRRKRRTAGFTKGGGYLGAARRAEVGEGTPRKRGPMRRRAAEAVMVAPQAPQQ